MKKTRKKKLLMTRRQIIKAGMIGGAGLMLPWKFKVPKVYGQIPGGNLDPEDVSKYQTPMLIPPVMPRAGIFLKFDYYEISMKQFSQQILPPGSPATTVWGYGAVKSLNKNGLLLHNAPSLTIEATHNRPVRIKWINDLKNPDGSYLSHLLPVDPTLHWANPIGMRDMRPDPDDPTNRREIKGSAISARVVGRSSLRRCTGLTSVSLTTTAVPLDVTDPMTD